jgi:hypothetical protein
MTTIEIMLPDELAQRAKSAGLLSDSAIQLLLEDAIRRRAGRALLDVARRIQEAGVEPLSMEEIDAEVKAYRAERRARDNAKNISPGGEPGDDAGRS